MHADTDDQRGHRARRMWVALEPIHTVTYFEAESQEVCTALGTSGFWMSYFALRAAPLGPSGPEMVTALFYGFAPGRVAKALPAAWEVATPQQFLDARSDAVDRALRRLLGPELIASAGLAEAAEIATAAAAAAPTTGRALAAANAALPVPDLPHLALWRAQTVLREQRGDGHVAALLAAGLDPVESLVLFGAGAPAELGELRRAENWRTWRGWTHDEWVAAASRLTGRGLVEAGGAQITAAGVELRRDVEAITDRLADAPWAAVGEAAAARLLELAAPARSAALAGAFPQVNPVGLTKV